MTKKTRKYTDIEKEKLTKRLLPPENCSPTKLSRETGISKSTLSTWKYKALQSNEKSEDKLSQEDKFRIVMETYTMSEIELSKYCRSHGYYVDDVKVWRQNCIEGNGQKSKDIKKNTELKSSLSEERKKTKKLEKDLRRKEKALAETAALLVLRKKLDAIFEDNEDD